ncbi:hypothetical protein N7537_008883 [Penicillium hordei]|uniref:Uncharacterized protein n=1 Tax=Penicillium hordei TaxID=40994 RepID=A0AAD6E1U1_9EURO|nr:uncharacterized protein N7537_008883 [Penicillium hordei]KAJ5598799.1 hypothetical protein N7537_008883 [Penicillium hordei]
MGSVSNKGLPLLMKSIKFDSDQKKHHPKKRDKGNENKNKSKKETSPGRLELPTSRLTVGRANQLRHGDLFNKIVLAFSTSTSPWRNWLARPTVNREVGSSSLPGDVSFLLFAFCFLFFDYYLYLFPFLFPLSPLV